MNGRASGHVSSRLPSLVTSCESVQIAVLRMNDLLPTTSSEAVSEASSLSPRAISRIAGEVAAILRGPPTSSSSSNPLSVTSTDVDTATTTSGIIFRASYVAT